MKIISIITLLASTLLTLANTDLRNWKLTDGKTVHAAISAWDPDSDSVTLKYDDGTSLEVLRTKLSLIDQAWVRQWHRFNTELEKRLETAGGIVKNYQSDGDYATDFYVYYPSVYKEGAKLPIILLFQPGGKGKTCLKRHFEAAESVGMILVTVDSFHNTKSDELVADMRKRFEHLLPVIEATVPHNPKKFFMGGLSGGAWRAFHYSVHFARPWAGIYSNGGWLGGHKYYDLAYPAGMRVAIANGDRDHASRWIKSDSKVLTDRGADIALFAFEGGHQAAPTTTQIDAFRWMLGLPERE
jgi:hypothetical protein